MSQELINALPSMFSTMHQKSAMCEFLWTTNDDPTTIIYNLRLYDLIRRLYYVKTQEEPPPTRVIELMDFVKSHDELNDFFMHYCKIGKFPSVNTLKLINN